MNNIHIVIPQPIRNEGLPIMIDGDVFVDGKRQAILWQDMSEYRWQRLTEQVRAAGGNTELFSHDLLVEGIQRLLDAKTSNERTAACAALRFRIGEGNDWV